MRALLLAALFAVILSLPAYPAGFLIYEHHSPYVGPGDLQTFLAWWGVRAYSAATRGNKALNVCTADNGGGTCADFVTDSTTGKLVVTTIAGTNCAVSTCYVKTAYDQTGNNNNISVVNHSPTLSTNCLNSMPCMVFNGSTEVLCGTTGSSLSQPISHYAVGIRTGAFTTDGTFVSNFNAGGATTGPRGGPTTSTNTARAAANSAFTATMSDSAWHVYQAVYSGSSSVLSIDAVDTTGNPGTGGGSASGNVCIGELDTFGTGAWLNGDLTETGETNTAISSGNRTSLCHNAYAFWATSTSC